MGKGPKLEHAVTPQLIPKTLFGRNEFSSDVLPDKLFCGLSINGVLNSIGELYTWGKNRSACLGLGEAKDDQFFPLRVCAPAKFKTVSLGADHCVGLGQSLT